MDETYNCSILYIKYNNWLLLNINSLKERLSNLIFFWDIKTNSQERSDIFFSFSSIEISTLCTMIYLLIIYTSKLFPVNNSQQFVKLIHMMQMQPNIFDMNNYVDIPFNYSSTAFMLLYQNKWECEYGNTVRTCTIYKSTWLMLSINTEPK